MAELHLIGTLAHDPDGPERLARLLDEVQPDALAVETSHAAFERQGVSGDLASAGAADAIAAKGADAATLAFWRRWLAKEQLHYESFTAAAHAARHGWPLYFLEPDLSAAPNAPADGQPPDQADELNQGQGETRSGGAGQRCSSHRGCGLDDPTEAYRLADLDTLRGIAGYDWRSDYASHYARARVDLEAKACLEFLLPVSQQMAYHRRTQGIAAQIAPLLVGQAARRVAIVCALTQLYFSEARLTVYAQLYDATAQRYLADGAGAVRDHVIVLPWRSAGAAVPDGPTL